MIKQHPHYNENLPTTRDGRFVQEAVTPDPEFIEALSDFESKTFSRGYLLINDNSHEVLDAIEKNPDQVQIIGKSGHSRISIDIMRIGKPQREDETTLLIPVQITILENQDTELAKDILNTIINNRLKVGRAVVVDENRSLNTRTIKKEIEMQRLWLPKEHEILDDGTIKLKLSDITYALKLHLLGKSEMEILKTLTMGKHRLKGISYPDKKDPNFNIDPFSHWVGSIKIALGLCTALIDRKQMIDDEKYLLHLGAMIMDALRTTGIYTPREIELYNPNESEIDLSEIMISLRLYPNEDNFTLNAAKKLLTAQTLVNGILFENILEEHQRDIKMILKNHIHPKFEKEKNHAMILAGGRFSEVPWEDDKDALTTAIKIIAEDLLSKGKGTRIKECTPEEIKKVTDSLATVGGNQAQGRIFLSRHLPEPQQLTTLYEEGIGVFVIESLGWNEEVMFGEKGYSANHYFEDHRYDAVLHLYKKGAQFWKLFPESKSCEEHWRTFHKGFWIRPEDREKFDSVDTVIAMYGSAVEELEGETKDTFADSLNDFYTKLHKLFEDENGNPTVGITHGKGGGLMKLHDDLAKEHGLATIAAGIDLEKVGQEAHQASTALIDVKAKNRLPRQNIMDDISTFQIFNIGGLGTLEEIGVSLCTRKLYNKISAPLIFVDPNKRGWGSNGEHLYGELVKLVKNMANDDEERAQGLENVKQLCKPHNYKNMHLVKSYDEAYDIIEEFVKNPRIYYGKIGMTEEQIKMSIEGDKEMEALRMIPFPGKWFRKHFGEYYPEFN